MVSITLLSQTSSYKEETLWREGCGVYQEHSYGISVSRPLDLHTTSPHPPNPAYPPSEYLPWRLCIAYLPEY